MSAHRCPSCNAPLTPAERALPNCPVCNSPNERAGVMQPLRQGVSVSPPLVEIQEPAPSEPAVRRIKGNAGKERLFAAICDNLLSLITATVTIQTLAFDDIWIRGSVFVVVYLAYYFLTEGLLSTTPGKFVFGLRVRTTAGQRCGWRAAGIRTLLRVIDVNPLLLGGIPAIITVLSTGTHQRFGDMLAGTVVVATADLF